MTDQLSFDGIPRCGFVAERCRPHRNVPCDLACTLAPHANEIPHRLEWQPIASRSPAALVVIEGGGL